MAQSSTSTRSRSNAPRRRSAPVFVPREMPPAPVQAFEGRSRSDLRMIAIAQFLRALPAVVAALGIVGLVTGNAAIGAVLLVVGLVVFGANLRIGSSRRLVGLIDGVPADAVRDARLINVVDGLCVANGLRMPRLSIVADDAPNAIVIGRSLASAVLVCTTGLLDELDRIELEGVVAHCLARVKRGDILQARTATTALGAVVAVVPSASRLVAHLSGIAHIFYDDLAGVAMTRYPPGLSAALDKLGVIPSTRPHGLSPLTARLTAAMWCVPLREALPTKPVEGVLDLALRAAALREL